MLGVADFRLCPYWWQLFEGVDNPHPLLYDQPILIAIGLFKGKSLRSIFIYSALPYPLAALTNQVQLLHWITNEGYLQEVAALPHNCKLVSRSLLPGDRFLVAGKCERLAWIIDRLHLDKSLLSFRCSSLDVVSKVLPADVLNSPSLCNKQMKNLLFGAAPSFETQGCYSWQVADRDSADFRSIGLPGLLRSGGCGLLWQQHSGCSYIAQRSQ